MKKKILFYRLILLVLVYIGLFLQIYPNKFFKLTYYTTLSNVLVALFFSYVVFAMLKGFDRGLNTNFFFSFKGAVTIAITLTFLVYATLLAPKSAPEDFFTLRNFLLHYIVPILVIVDWFVFDDKNRYSVIEPFKWISIPFAYIVFAMVKGYVFNIPIPDEPSSPYPYFFVDLNKIGISGVLKYSILIVMVYILLGYIMYFIKSEKSCDKVRI